ncbi:hypothetical protein PFMC_00884 [Plasmodium falciparum CAMP/Malaysia]|uniref:Uncharacterized protein n=1 Tax=Plasmodium falciparum (isolate Camp / Malaysia) TaxID=5835 RepID=A0A024XDG5_PLAFC|nr:hypothetical protein PFMC_00884 [Plasmodium falciparum CAMP/Malaysia]
MYIYLFNNTHYFINVVYVLLFQKGLRKAYIYIYNIHSLVNIIRPKGKKEKQEKNDILQIFNCNETDICYIDKEYLLV